MLSNAILIPRSLRSIRVFDRKSCSSIPFTFRRTFFTFTPSHSEPLKISPIFRFFLVAAK